MNCLITNGQCERCGKAARHDRVRRNCSGPPGLGDYVEKALSAVGITKKLVAKLTGKADCGCQERQDALNRFWRWLKSTPQK